MIQIWILRRDVDPLTANRSNLDKAICGNCPLRGNKGQDRACYVLLKNAPLAVYNAYQRGNYPKLPILDVFNGRAVRFGAYGDPVHIPLPLMQAIADRAQNWTGYTHQWRNPLFAAYRQLLMASVETLDQALTAGLQGWRSFRVAKHSGDLGQGEIVCVNESRGVTCEKCGLCKGSAIRAKSITITVHGNGAANFQN